MCSGGKGASAEEAGTRGGGGVGWPTVGDTRDGDGRHRQRDHSYNFSILVTWSYSRNTHIVIGTPKPYHDLFRNNHKKA